MFTFLKQNTSSKKKKSIPHLIAKFWLQRHERIFFFAFLGIFIYGCLLWYKDVYHFQWDPAEKQAYIQSKETKTVFKESSFKTVIQTIERRKSVYESEYNPVRDIFFAK